MLDVGAPGGGEGDEHRPSALGAGGPFDEAVAFSMGDARGDGPGCDWRPNSVRGVSRPMWCLPGYIADTEVLP